MGTARLGGSGLESVMRFWPRCYPGFYSSEDLSGTRGVASREASSPPNPRTSKWPERVQGLVSGATQHHFHHIHSSEVSH